MAHIHQKLSVKYQTRQRQLVLTEQFDLKSMKLKTWYAQTHKFSEAYVLYSYKCSPFLHSSIRKEQDNER